MSLYSLTIRFSEPFAKWRYVMGTRKVEWFIYGIFRSIAVAAFLVALAQSCGTLAAVLIVDKFGRKVLLVLSDVFMALPLAALGTYFYLDENRIICGNGTNGTQLLMDQNVCDGGYIFLSFYQTFKLAQFILN